MTPPDWTGYFADRADAKAAELGLRLEIQENGVRLIYRDGLPCSIGAASSAADLCYWLDGFAAARVAGEAGVGA